MQEGTCVFRLSALRVKHFPGGLNRQVVQTFEVVRRRGYQARIADAGRRLVTPEDVSRWATQGHVDVGSHDYCFMDA
jgi:hypothetical protein